MNYIIITLLLIIILLNLKNDENKKQKKDKNIKGGIIVNTIKNIFILFIVLTIIIYISGSYIIKGASIQTFDSFSLIILSCIISFIVSCMTILVGLFSYTLIKFLIVFAVLLSLISTYIDSSALLSYQSGCTLEPLFNSEKTDIAALDKLGTNFMYTSDELNSIKDNPSIHIETCMAMHTRSHAALKGSKSGLMGRLSPFSYSITSWIGYIFNYLTFVMIMAALSITDNTNSMTRLATES